MAEHDSDGTLHEIAAEIERVRKQYAGALAFQKFTCAKCGSRQTMTEPNTIYRSGSCAECGHITQIERCGFSLIIPGNAEAAAIARIVTRPDRENN